MALKLSNWAKQQNISYCTAWRWFKQNKLPVKSWKSPSGSIFVEPNHPVKENKDAWIYCRVSSYNKKEDLKRQTERCINFCENNGWTITQCVKEIASGTNDKRTKLTKLLESNPTRIVVEHKDRLTSFGFSYFEKFLPMIGCELIVINRDKDKDKDKEQKNA